MNRCSLLLTMTILIVVAMVGACTPTLTPTITPSITSTPTPTIIPEPTPPQASIEILVDDFRPQPYQGQPVYFYNRLGGDRGALNESVVDWGRGQVTTTVAPGRSWGGVWMSLNHPIREGLPLDFSAILPDAILPAYQSNIVALNLRVASGTKGRTLKIELKDGDALRWKSETLLNGDAQVLSFDLPPTVGKVNHLVWVLDNASPGDTVVLERVSLTATTQITDTAMRGFVWSYAMLLANWDEGVGHVRDKAHVAAGEFEATQTTGSLAAVTAVAEQLGVVSHSDATSVVNRISQALLVETPRYHGLLPHFVQTSANGAITIVPETEWSSIDTVIAAIGLLTAQSSLGLDTWGAESLLREIDWADLTRPDGMIAMGYDSAGVRIPWAWDTFGGEAWLMELSYAAATGQVAPLAHPAPPTAGGAGFIDELHFLFVPPPPGPDFWGTDWSAYRSAAADNQIHYYPTHYPDSCLTQLAVFGLSAAEVPDPTLVPVGSIYQAFGVTEPGPAKDGAALLGAPVVVPHYAAMIASVRPQAATAMWDWLIAEGYFTPLTNVESLMFPAGASGEPNAVAWNHLKGSWNLALQSLGWGRYLAERNEQVPALWQAATTNPFLSKGYRLLATAGGSLASPTPAPKPGPTEMPTPWSVTRECESPDESTVGQTIERLDASGGKVHGQFGTVPAWPAQPGVVKYTGIDLPQTDHLYIRLRYSKFSPLTAPIRIHVDNRQTPAASYQPVDQGSWDRFVWTEPILLGSIQPGVHTITFATDGQEYGVADLDVFILAGEPPAEQPVAAPVVPSVAPPTRTPTPTPRVPMPRNPE